MPMSINHLTYVISIPKADTVFVETNAETGYEIRSYDEYAFMREVGAYLDTEPGIVLDDTHEHFTSNVLSGVEYARIFKLLAPYTITIEDGAYQVKLVGGTNTNFIDVLNPNNVSVIPDNSAGKQVIASSSGLLPGDTDDIADAVLGSPIASYEDTETLAGAVTHLKHLRYMLFINTELGIDGDGSQHAPFNNETSAIDYAESHGIKMLMVMADITFTRQIKNFEIHGVGVPQVDLNGQDITGTLVVKCRPTGLYLGTATFQDCNLNGLMTLNGYIDNCAVSGPFQIPDGGTAFVKGTAALVAGQTKPVFDIGGVAGTAKLVLMGYDGGCTIENCNQSTDDVKVVLNRGIIELGASCTDGNIYMFGDVKTIRSDNGSIVHDYTIDPVSMREIWQLLGLDSDNPVDGTVAGTIAVGNIIQNIIDNGNGTGTVTRA